MASQKLSLKSLLPVGVDTLDNTLQCKTFVGIDFGTSTTVVSIARIDPVSGRIKSQAIRLNQKDIDGAIISSEKVPTVIAWHKEDLLIGEGAARLKFQAIRNKNIWYSFKMDLGEDLGALYYDSELAEFSDVAKRLNTHISNPKDATALFFKYLRVQIEKYVAKNNLPPQIQYAVSIPASFEANQRRELVDALEVNGMSISKQSLIDEPNAAFMSYISCMEQENQTLNIPAWDNPKVLVFDFGAGTCDISILELGQSHNGLYSKNLSISKFEKLGGDDIDKLIAIDYLYPQMLEESKLQDRAFKQKDRVRIMNTLIRPAEQLKILISDTIATMATGRILPEEAYTQMYKSLATIVSVETKQGTLKLTNPKLSFYQFSQAMDRILNSKGLTPYKVKSIDGEFVSIYTPIQTALKKANLTRDDIDYILFIGGSSKNPYVQDSLRKYFPDAELLIPRDLQTHVSQGAAIHSLIYNGFGKNVITPITSEPIIVLTKNTTPTVLLKAGTNIPSDVVTIDNLQTVYNGQKAIELPICIGSTERLLYNLRIVSSSPKGFSLGERVTLSVELTADKLLNAQASAADQIVQIEPMNPFANKELSTEQRVVLRAERESNLAALKNNGKPTRIGLKELANAYEKVGAYLKAAETIELMEELYPGSANMNNLGVLYSHAGYEDRALEYYRQDYEQSPSSTNAFNYAYKLENVNEEDAKRIYEHSLKLNPKNPHTLYQLGKLYRGIGNPEGFNMIQKAFEIWENKFKCNQLELNEYSWLSSVAEELGMREFAKMVRESRPRQKQEALYNSDNFVVHSKNTGLVSK